MIFNEVSIQTMKRIRFRRVEAIFFDKNWDDSSETIVYSSA